ncbi:spermatogenesis associated 2-like [Toxotes jaculatrix]|uniref:spermatogenesis associated 2-like n=1 Tax=Toxotes jaculatrix TaxID=941984 RepID=UPI001B3A81F6|nr:spermatogenesis associated 2-like [Toxotes jaculatrix]XP_040894243.1 spermatogenesis associated 2-like [Toxotes jaculatrix]
MIEMNNSRQRARDLLSAYDHSLEQQIVGRGSNLACSDEELWRQVEGPLRDGDAQETHCLGLDPLRVMEESLTSAAAASTASGGQVKARGGLQGLAKAFEVLEQAALNLYLGPWRDEYKVVKMYSGMFTHYIKPVLSMPQIEKLFGLLGYEPSSSRHEQLFLQVLTVSPSSPDDLLRLSCAFYLARCECRLLQTALGKHVGEAQWELSVVRERQRGNSLQVALDNTMKTLKVNQPPIEPCDRDVDMDLYTDEHINGGQREVTQRSASSSAVQTHGDDGTSLSSSSTSPSTREHVCISTLSCQQTKLSPLELDSNRRSLATKWQGKHPCEELDLDNADLQSQPGSLPFQAVGCTSEAEANHFCSGLQSDPRYCAEWETVRNNTCAFPERGLTEEHSLVTFDSTAEQMKEPGAASPQSESSSAAVPPLSLCDEPKSTSSSCLPIAYHDCCNLTRPNPQVLCWSCRVFHSYSCKSTDYCKIHHTTKPLAVCVCGKTCSRNPLVLCRYCGNEYCNDCWYRRPVECACGQTFDMSSPV